MSSRHKVTKEDDWRHHGQRDKTEMMTHFSTKSLQTSVLAGVLGLVEERVTAAADDLLENKPEETEGPTNVMPAAATRNH